MGDAVLLSDLLSADSFLEYAFLRWVLTPAVSSGILTYVTPQQEVIVEDRRYYMDYAIVGSELRIAVELDGYEFHSDRVTFSSDRLRQNDLHATGWIVVRFSYDAIRESTGRCVSQLQAVLSRDPELAKVLISNPVLEQPDMAPDPAFGLRPAPRRHNVTAGSEHPYFDKVREKINHKTLRTCQMEALLAFEAYYGSEGQRAACVMSVGAGKTTLGVVACLTFTQRRALIITPGSVIRGTFDKALDHTALGNSLYGLPGGPLIPGCKPPIVLTLDRDEGPIREVTRQQLLAADIIVTNFHSLGTGEDPDDLLGKLSPWDIDYIVVDEAHIAAAESYQRTFAYFKAARALLMSACFQRLDGKPIEADVVYRYRLIDSIADGNAKNMQVQRFAPNAEQTTYEMIWPDGSREEIIGRDALLELVKDERKLARITAKSDTSIRQVMRAVKSALERQAQLVYPIKPRVLFSALGERHAEQIARIATEYGIPTDYLHHSMTESRVRAVRARFEQDSGDLQGVVQLKMLGQGYDFPPICIVVPMRPYGSFSEFYQFVGRGIRVLQHPAFLGRVTPGQQLLDVIYHAELGLDEHIETIYRENDMDRAALHTVTGPEIETSNTGGIDIPGIRGTDEANRPDTFVLFEQGAIEQRIVHDKARVEQRRLEREQEALAQRYAQYAQTTPDPVTFEQFVKLLRVLSE